MTRMLGLMGLLLILASGCGGTRGTGTTGGGTTMISGIAVDPDSVNLLHAMGVEPGPALGMSLRGGIPVYPDTEPSMTVISAMDGTWSLRVASNSSVRIGTNATSQYPPFRDNGAIMVGTAALMMLPAHILPKTNSSPAAAAAAAGIAVDALIAQGACIADVLDRHTPPIITGADSRIAVTETGYDIFAVEFSHAGQVTATRSDHSTWGRFVI